MILPKPDPTTPYGVLRMIKENIYTQALVIDTKLSTKVDDAVFKETSEATEDEQTHEEKPHFYSAADGDPIDTTALVQHLNDISWFFTGEDGKLISDFLTTLDKTLNGTMDMEAGATEMQDKYVDILEAAERKIQQLPPTGAQPGMRAK